MTTPPDTTQAITSDVTRQVVVMSGDLFFGMRIRTVLRQLGYSVVLTKTAAEFQEKSTDAILGLVDFNQPVMWDELAPIDPDVLPILAFGSHTDVDGFRAAKQAGVSRVVSNGEFNRSLPALAKKYARK